MAAVSSRPGRSRGSSTGPGMPLPRRHEPVKPRPLASGVTLRNGEVELGVDVWPERDPDADAAGRVSVRRAANRRSPTRRFETLSERTPDWPQPWPTGAADELVALLLEGRGPSRCSSRSTRPSLFTRMLPEWAPVRSRPQRNAYHRFTVDRHLWEAAAQAALLADRVARPDLLVIGALLHDIGKGYPGDHTERGEELVAAIGPRMGFDDRDTASAGRIGAPPPAVARHRDPARSRRSGDDRRGRRSGRQRRCSSTCCTR